MNEMKPSALLAKLIELAKNTGDKKDAPLTAERFVVAVIDHSAGVGADLNDADLAALKASLEEWLPDSGKARKILLGYINSGNPTAFIDDLYMKKKMKEAEDLSKTCDMTEIDADLLFVSIMRDPSDAVKKALLAMPSEEDPDPNGFDQDFFERIDLEISKMLSKLDTSEQPFGSDKKEEDHETPKTERKKNAPSLKNEVTALVRDVKRIREELQDSIYGQDNAINVFTSGYFQANLLSMIDKHRRRPRATFLFAGPPGVGKTFLAEKAAESLKLPFMRFDMSEYCDKEAAIEFCGSDGVYKNSKQGNFTSYVSENPKCVILFDEIEKAHISIIHLFLQILDAGRIRDNQTDKEISLKDTILIFTTNAGKQLYRDSEMRDLSTVSRKVIIDALEKDVNPATGNPYFPGAICSRFASGNVVMFNHIGAYDLRQIAKKEIERHANNLKNEIGIGLETDEEVYTALLFSEGTNADARTIRSRAETFFNDELYELLRLVASEKVKTNIDDIESIRIGVDLGEAPNGIASLFGSGKRAHILMIADGATVAFCKKKVSAFKFTDVQKAEDAIAVIRSKDVDLVMLDMKFGADTEYSESLNIEDIASPARDLFRFLRDQKSELPIYLIENGESDLTDEETISFIRQGVRGVLDLEDSRFADQLGAISSILHQQASMEKLARENKLISFETAQTVSRDGRNAEITLFDFREVVAIDSEDTKNVLSSVSIPNVRFNDVIGAREAKEELNDFVVYLKNPKKYMGTGVKAPKGIILHGPPGTGKTMLAKAMACEAGVTFIAAEGNQFLKKYVGEGPQAVHDLFRTARKYAPSILFIDEIDAIAKERHGGSESAAGVEATLTALLTEMDGFVSDPSKPVFVLAATNFDVEPGGAKSLDPALMRRFDRRIYIGLPDREDRIRYLRMKIAKNPALVLSREEIENIAMRSTSMSLAELDSAIELALRSAIREGSTTVTDEIFEEAFETFTSGEVKVWDASQLERVARHEAGHALISFIGGVKPSYLTVVARSNHGGYMMPSVQEGKMIYTKDELLARIRTSLGGRAAEIVYYGERDGISTGASGDLVSATNTARHIICTYGMDGDFGLAVIGDAEAKGAMSAEVREAVNAILSEQMAEAIRIISENKDKIDALVVELMSKNHLNATEIEKILGDRDV